LKFDKSKSPSQTITKGKNMKTETRKKQLISLMFKKGEITASEVFHISNANQYFADLENQGITKSRWLYDENGRRKCKVRSIKDYARAKSLVKG
jgi:putative beta-lactamase hcpC